MTSRSLLAATLRNNYVPRYSRSIIESQLNEKGNSEKIEAGDVGTLDQIRWLV